MGKMTMRPSKPLSTGAVVFLVLMLMFGMAFFNFLHTVLSENEAPSGFSVVIYLFMALWVGAILYQLAYHVMNLRRAKGMPLVDIESEPGLPGDATPGDPMQRLRTLEKLKSDGLITEEEYRRKREEMMKEKW